VQADVALSTGDSIIIPGVKDKDGKIFTLFDQSFPKDGTHGEVVIRPEEITIVKDSVNFNARVKDIEYFGHDALVYLEMKNSTVSDICARITAPIEFKVGEEVMAKNIAQLRWFQKS
jgi:ABC-type sugar transport system ATPase subunit